MQRFGVHPTLRWTAFLWLGAAGVLLVFANGLFATPGAAWIAPGRGTMARDWHLRARGEDTSQGENAMTKVIPWLLSAACCGLLLGRASPLEADASDYIIKVNYEGPLTLSRIEVLLYETDRTCDGLLEDPVLPPSPDTAWTSLVILPDAEGNIPERGIEVPRDTTFHYAVARAEPSDGEGGGLGYFVTFGCTDAIPPPDPSTAAVIEIDMHHLWPDAAGGYAVETVLVPPELPVDALHVKDAIKELIQYPGLGVLRLLAIAEAGSSYWEVSPWQDFFECKRYASGSDVVQCATVRPTRLGWQRAAELEEELDAGFATYAGSRTSVAEALRPGREILFEPSSLGLTGVLTIAQDPDPDGALGESNQISFHELEWRWPEGERRTVLREEWVIRGENITAGIGLQPDPEPRSEYILSVEPFALDFSYGELMVAVLEGVVFPETLFSSADRIEGIGSLEDFFTELVDCPALPEAERQGCEILRLSASEAIAIWTANPTPETATWATWRTPAERPCIVGFPLSEPSFQVETLGEVDIEGRCEWDGALSNLAGTENVPMSATWWAERQGLPSPP